MKPSSSNNNVKPSIPMPRSVSLGPPPRSLLRLGRQQQQQQQQHHVTKQPMLFHHHPSPPSAPHRSNSNNTGFVRESTKKHPPTATGGGGTAVASFNAAARTPWMWHLTELLPVPFYHPLEPSAIHVKDVSLATISTRISTFMRVNSISCTYHTNVGQVIGLTPSLLKFSVQLWKGTKEEDDNKNENDNHGGNLIVDERNKDDTNHNPTNDNVNQSIHVDTTTKANTTTTTTTTPNNNNDDSDIILEISRVAGCAMEMQRLRNWLIYSVTTGDLSTIPVDHRGLGARCASRLRSKLEPPAEDDDDNHNLYQFTPRRNEHDCLDALKIALTLLQSKCLDQNRLGMESLCVLTHRFNVSDTAALLVAKALVYGQGEFGPRLQQAMMRYFQNMERNLDHDNNSDSEDSGGWYDSDDECAFLDYRQGCTFGIIHNLALQALLNALETVALQDNHGPAHEKVAATEKSSHVLNLKSRFWQVVLSAFMYHIQEAEHRPHEASLAAACFYVLDENDNNANGLEGGSDAMELLKRDNLLPAVVHAHEYGKVFHLTLEQSSRHLIQSLKATTTTPTTTTTAH